VPQGGRKRARGRKVGGRDFYLLSRELNSPSCVVLSTGQTPGRTVMPPSSCVKHRILIRIGHLKMTSLYAEAFKLGQKNTQLLAEAQVVLSLRLLGLSGFWTLAPGENNRMLQEKQTSYTKAAMDAFVALWSGARPDQVYSAALEPIGKTITANAKRLQRQIAEQQLRRP
jgi:hypothetical protein